MGRSATYWQAGLNDSATSNVFGGVDPLGVSCETLSSDGVLLSCGLEEFVPLERPGRLANFRFEGVYSQGRSLRWHLAHLGKSPLHFVL